MSKALVTGVAGFIGSNLAERLLADGWQVTGVDCFTDYYARSIKERNLATLKDHPQLCLCRGRPGDRRPGAAGGRGRHGVSRGRPGGGAGQLGHQL